LNHPQLPDRVASHFDASGRPNGWMSRDAFTAFTVGFTLFLAGVPAGLARWLPRIPDSLINLPNKAHWLAPGRRAATLRFVGDWLLWQGCATLGLLLFVFGEVHRANQSSTPRLTAIGAPIAIFLLWTTGAVGLLLARFVRRK